MHHHRSLAPAVPTGSREFSGRRLREAQNIVKAFQEQFPTQAAIYTADTAHDRPNYLGAQVPVRHAFNMQVWKRYAHLLEDTTLVPMLEYGFPIGYKGLDPPRCSVPLPSPRGGPSQKQCSLSCSRTCYERQGYSARGIHPPFQKGGGLLLSQQRSPPGGHQGARHLVVKRSPALLPPQPPRSSTPQ